MPALQSAWIFYLSHPALVINALALFYALSGAWLVFATQYRSRHTGFATSPLSNAGTAPLPELDAATQRVNRMFYAVATACLGLALLLSLISTAV
ncbi:MAG: hypothetical protein EA348_11870 [Pseudomonadaceae bacterium]|nr:MAG: hypothetical protein EA348_11870 [Pseudomonadaceae bacterium]